MKETRSLLNSLVVCGVALLMASPLAAQTANEIGAKVIRLKGDAQYKVGSTDWQPLKVGDVLRSGAVIQTAGNSHVDLALGESSASVVRPTPDQGINFVPNADQNFVRVWENTLLGIDTLTSTQTGAGEVTETQLNLKTGHIFGMVKKMSAGSRYEVTIPIGVAGIRGTVYDISAEGVIKVLSGSAVLAYVGPGGTQKTQVIMALQMFDARTEVLSELPYVDKVGMGQLVDKLPMPIMTPTLFIPDKTVIHFVSPH
jgi:FecR protein